MSFQAEPTFSHGQENPIAILYGNLGTPDAPTAKAVRRYLAQFLSDPRVVEIPRALWWLILHGIILRIRPRASAAKYASIWTDQGSPLWVNTRAQAQGLAAALQTRGHSVLVLPAMRYGQPSVASQLDALKALGVQRILVLPAYPQYSATTTASLFDAIYKWAQRIRCVPEMRFVNRYHDDPSYIAALAQSVRGHWQVHGQSAVLLMSFHGVPERTLKLGDPYHCECLKTGRLLAQALGLTSAQYRISFQSRFGKAKWLQPYTEPTLVALAEQGVKSVDVVCPGFVVDCLETLEEIAQEAREAFLQAGGQAFEYIPCLNAQACEALADVALRHLQGWPTTATGPASDADAVRQRALCAGAAR